MSGQIVVSGQSVTVRLTSHDRLRAAAAGCVRRNSHLDDNQPRYGAAPHGVDFWDRDINAAAAELAVALYLTAPWTGETSRHADVGEDIQVRHSRRSDAHLLVWTGDRESDRFVLVTGFDGEYVLRGWLPGHLAKQPDRLRRIGGRSAYWSSQLELQPMEELRP